jgi:phage regulator Rha-like protein
MLASVLNSEKAIAVNIQIIRAFIKMRHFLQDAHELHGKIKILESEIKKELQTLTHTSDFHDQQIQNLYDLLNQFHNTNDDRENREKI